MSSRESKRPRLNSPDREKETDELDELDELVQPGTRSQTILEEPNNREIEVLMERMKNLDEIFVSLNNPNTHQKNGVIKNLTTETADKLLERESRSRHEVGPIRVTPAELQTLSNFNLISIDLGNTFTSDQQAENWNNIQQVRRLQAEINRLEDEAIGRSLENSCSSAYELINKYNEEEVESLISETPRRNMGGPGGPSTRRSDFPSLFAQNQA